VPSTNSPKINPINGYINLDDNTPGLGISLNEKYESEFKVME